MSESNPFHTTMKSKLLDNEVKINIIEEKDENPKRILSSIIIQSDNILVNESFDNFNLPCLPCYDIINISKQFKTENGSKSSLVYKDYMFHCISLYNIKFVCISEKNIKYRIVYHFLENIIEEFIKACS